MRLFLAPTSGNERTPANDIDVEVVKSTAAGVVFEHDDEVCGLKMGDDHIVRTPRGDAAWFTDPDGNLLVVPTDKLTHPRC